MVFNLRERVEYVGRDLRNQLDEGRMFGTIVSKRKNYDGTIRYAVFMDKRYSVELHDCNTSESEYVLIEYYDYDFEYEDYSLKKDRGWFTGEENIRSIKKGNTSIFRRVNNV